MAYSRLAWHDQFTRPTPQRLRRDLPTPIGKIFDATRTHLRQIAGDHETVVWYGHSWHWSIEYRTQHHGEPLAILIPSPSDLQLAMPLEQSFLTTLPTRRLKRAVRDGLDLAQDPFDTRWGVWSLHQGDLIDDLKGLLDRKMQHLSNA